jgi:hypothetical protein
MDETVDGDPGNASATKMIANGIQILCQYIAGRRLDVLARSERFELPTLGFEVRCSIQLSYERSFECSGYQSCQSSSTALEMRTFHEQFIQEPCLVAVRQRQVGFFAPIAMLDGLPTH